MNVKDIVSLLLGWPTFYFELAEEFLPGSREGERDPIIETIIFLVICLIAFLFAVGILLPGWLLAEYSAPIWLSGAVAYLFPVLVVGYATWKIENGPLDKPAYVGPLSTVVGTVGLILLVFLPPVLIGMVMGAVTVLLSA